MMKAANVHDLFGQVHSESTMFDARMPTEASAAIASAESVRARLQRGCRPGSAAALFLPFPLMDKALPFPLRPSALFDGQQLAGCEEW